MVKVNLGGCSSFVKDADYKEYVGKALEALDVLNSGSGAGNDFLGWKHLPSETPESLILDPFYLAFVEAEHFHQFIDELLVAEADSESFGKFPSYCPSTGTDFAADGNDKFVVSVHEKKFYWQI